jgi:hypothetical protein
MKSDFPKLPKRLESQLTDEVHEALAIAYEAGQEQERQRCVRFLHRARSRNRTLDWLESQIIEESKWKNPKNSVTQP